MKLEQIIKPLPPAARMAILDFVAFLEKNIAGKSPQL